MDVCILYHITGFVLFFFFLWRLILQWEFFVIYIFFLTLQSRNKFKQDVFFFVLLDTISLFFFVNCELKYTFVNGSYIHSIYNMYLLKNKIWFGLQWRRLVYACERVAMFAIYQIFVCMLLARIPRRRSRATASIQRYQRTPPWNPSS